MTTLRDYVLDCRCPNCGTLMQQREPERESWRSLIRPIFVALVVIGAVVNVFASKYAEAAYLMSLATFMVVTDR